MMETPLCANRREVAGERPRLGRLPVDLVTRDQALERIADLVREGRGGTVFTPNVDHVLLAEQDARFRAAYEAASLSLVDGMPVLWALRLAGHPIPGKISGSDLVRPLAARAADEGWRLFLVGGAPGVGERVAGLLRAEHSALTIVGVQSPLVDMDGPVDARRGLRVRIRQARPDLVLVALGSPKGELWADEAREELRPAVVVAVGAALDFLAGRARRAPAWISDIGLEWLFRLAHEPTRLWRRYLVRGPRFLPFLLQARRLRRNSRPALMGSAPAMATSSVGALRVGLLAALLPFVVYAGFVPATVNLDGLDYLERFTRGGAANILRPGHLLYGPFVVLLDRLLDDLGLTLLAVLRLVSHLAGALGALLTARIAARWGAPPAAQLMAALGLAFSYGYWIEAADVETYAPTMLGVVASLYLMTRCVERPGPGRAVALALANAATALMNLQLVSLATASLSLMAVTGHPDRFAMRKAVGSYLLAFGLGLGLPYVTATVLVLGHRNMAEALSWLAAADYGLKSPFDALSVPRALYGLARTLLFLEPYFQAPFWIVAAKGLLLFAAAAWTLRFVVPRIPSVPDVARVVLRSTLPFVLIHAGLGLLWFPSELERWIYFLPLLWLGVATAVPSLPPRQRAWAGAAVALMAVVNLAGRIWPLHTDTTARERVFALQRALRPGVLVVTPGWDWLGYYRFYTGNDLDTLSLMQLALLHQRDHVSFYRDVESRLERATAAGRPVAMVRILDPTEHPKAVPWQTLAGYGYPIEDLRRPFRTREWREARLDDPGRTLLYWLRDPGPLRGSW